ncbi:MAG TPA: PEGA domain-containing protein [Terriglobales bacterium]|nr:PEGA domain-containing protein [Terriglobales bacterium]
MQQTMIRALIGLMAAGIATRAGVAQVVLPEGTKVRVRLEQDISSATAEEGQPVQLAVTEDVKIGDAVVIPQGSTAVGSIIQAVPKRRMGRTGKLDFSVERVVAADGNSVPLRYSINKKEGGSHAAATGALTAGAAIVFWPAAPVFLLMKGKDVTVHRGLVIEVFTDQKYMLEQKVAAVTPTQGMPPSAAAAIPTAAPGSPAAVHITSDPDGAEIEIDGAFVGSTPATLQMASGSHHLTVKRGLLAWQRDIQIQSGSAVVVNALLQK